MQTTKLPRFARPAGVRAFLAAGVMAALAALLPTAGMAADFVMKISTPPINELQHEWMKRYEVALEKKANGRIDVQLFPASQLGPIGPVIESVQLGVVEAMVVPPEFLGGVDLRFQTLAVPGLFENFDDARKILDKQEARDAFFNVGLDKGLVGISAMIYGEQVVATAEPVNTIADFSKKRIRVLASETERGMLAALGASPVPMPLTEVVPGLQQGAIDGVSSVPGPLTSFKAFEVAPYMVETKLWTIIPVTFVSKVWLDSLPADLQADVVDVARSIETDLHEWQRARMEQDRKGWVDGGGKVVSLSGPEDAEAKERAKKVADDFLIAHPEVREIYDALVAAR